MTKENIFHQVSKVALYEQVAQQMKEVILEGQYQPGERLPSERELSQLFGVGRPTVREALKTLSARGMVELDRSFRGYVVQSPDLEPYVEIIREQISWQQQVSEANIADFWDVIPHLLGMIVHSAIHRRRDDDLSELEDLVERMEACGRDLYTCGPLTYEFGLKVAARSGNQVATILWRMFREVISHEFPPIMTKLDSNSARKLVDYHRAILSALRERSHAAVDEAISERTAYLRRTGVNPPVKTGDHNNDEN